ncbi:MAG: methyltransferase domain-containing protein [Bacteroidota bacterium]
MIKPQLLSKLISPDDHSELEIDTNKKNLVSTDQKHHYSVIDGVPVLLPSNYDQVFEVSDVHQNLNSKFFYIDHYQKDAEVFSYFEEFKDGATIHENRRLHEAIVNQIPKNATNILDVGSGNAWLAKVFQHSIKEIISFDISTVNTQEALKRYPSENHYAVTGDVYSLPFKENVFDCIVAAEVIEHLPNPRKFIVSLLRVLKRGSKIIITTPYNEKTNYYLCVHCNKPTPEHAHIHSFTEGKILSLVPDQVQNKNAYAFSNKLATKFKTHILFKYLPFKLWRMVDGLINKILKRQGRLMLTISK